MHYGAGSCALAVESAASISGKVKMLCPNSFHSSAIEANRIAVWIVQREGDAATA